MGTYQPVSGKLSAKREHTRDKLEHIEMLKAQVPLREIDLARFFAGFRPIERNSFFPMYAPEPNIRNRRRVRLTKMSTSGR